MMNKLDELVKQIITKVRKEFRSNNEYSYLLGLDPEVIFVFKNGELKLKEIRFVSYDKIVIYDNGMYFCPEMRGAQSILKYKSWDGLLYYLNS